LVGRSHVVEVERGEGYLDLFRLGLIQFRRSCMKAASIVNDAEKQVDE
jgi:hypothetical protein